MKNHESTATTNRHRAKPPESRGLQTTDDGLRLRSFGSLLDGDGIEARGPLLGSWLRERDLVMAFAQAGVGKSLFAMGLSIALAGGGRYLDWESHGPRRVLVVDGEIDAYDLHERAVTLTAAADEIDREALRSNLQLIARQDQEPGTDFPDLNTPEGREQIIQLVERLKPSLVVLDNFSTLANVDDENAASSFNPIITLMQECQARGSAVLLVHHSKKGGSGSGGYRGTSKMEATFTQTIELSHPGGGPCYDGAAFNLRFHKSRRKRDHSTEPKEVRLTPDDDGETRWSYEPSLDVQLDELVALVRSVEYTTQAALAKAIGVDPGTVSRWKPKAIAAGKITTDEWTQCLKTAKELAFMDGNDAGEL